MMELKQRLTVRLNTHFTRTKSSIHNKGKNISWSFNRHNKLCNQYSRGGEVTKMSGVFNPYMVVDVYMSRPKAWKFQFLSGYWYWKTVLDRALWRCANLRLKRIFTLKPIKPLSGLLSGALRYSIGHSNRGIIHDAPLQYEFHGVDHWPVARQSRWPGPSSWKPWTVSQRSKQTDRQSCELAAQSSRCQLPWEGFGRAGQVTTKKK